MKTITSIQNKVKYIFLLLIFSSSFAYANDEEIQYSINGLLDKIVETGEKQIEIIDNLRESLTKDNKIDQKYINEYRISSKEYNDYVYLLNSIIINHKFVTLQYDNEKIIRILKTAEKYTNSMLLLLDEDLIFSKAQPNDIGYALSKILPRYIEAPSFLASKEQIAREGKIWENYKSISKSLFNFECFLRKIACNEDISNQLLNNNYHSFLLTQDRITMFAELASVEGPDQEFYLMMYKTIIYQYLYIYEQAIALKSKKYGPKLQKIIWICENIFDQAGRTDYTIEENEKGRYINALKISGKVIVPETVNKRKNKK